MKKFVGGDTTVFQRPPSAAPESAGGRYQSGFVRSSNKTGTFDDSNDDENLSSVLGEFSQPSRVGQDGSSSGGDFNTKSVFASFGGASKPPSRASERQPSSSMSSSNASSKLPSEPKKKKTTKKSSAGKVKKSPQSHRSKGSDGSGDQWKDRYLSLQRDYDALEATLKKKNDEISNLKRKGGGATTSELEQENARLKKDLQVLSARNQSLESENARLRYDLVGVTDEKGGLVNESADAFTRIRDLNRLKLQLQEKEEEIYNLKDQCDTLQKALNRARHGAGDETGLSGASVGGEKPKKSGGGGWFGRSSKKKDKPHSSASAATRVEGDSEILELDDFGGSDPKLDERVKRLMKRVSDLERELGRTNGEIDMLDIERKRLSENLKKTEAYCDILKAQVKKAHDAERNRPILMPRDDDRDTGDESRWKSMCAVQEQALRKLALEKEELEMELESLEAIHGKTLKKGMTTTTTAGGTKNIQEGIQMSGELTAAKQKVAELEMKVKELSTREAYMRSQLESNQKVLLEMEEISKMQKLKSQEATATFASMLAKALAENEVLSSSAAKERQSRLTGALAIQGELKMLREGRVRKMVGEPAAFTVFPSPDAGALGGCRFVKEKLLEPPSDLPVSPPTAGCEYKTTTSSASLSSSDRTMPGHLDGGGGSFLSSPSQMGVDQIVKTTTEVSATRTSGRHMSSHVGVLSSPSSVSSSSTDESIPLGLGRVERPVSDAYHYRWTGGGYVLEEGVPAPAADMLAVAETMQTQRVSVVPSEQGGRTGPRPMVSVMEKNGLPPGVINAGPFPEPMRNAIAVPEFSIGGPGYSPVSENDRVYAQTALKEWNENPPPQDMEKARDQYEDRQQQRRERRLSEGPKYSEKPTPKPKAAAAAKSRPPVSHEISQRPVDDPSTKELSEVRRERELRDQRKAEIARDLKSKGPRPEISVGEGVKKLHHSSDSRTPRSYLSTDYSDPEFSHWMNIHHQRHRNKVAYLESERIRLDVTESQWLPRKTPVTVNIDPSKEIPHRPWMPSIPSGPQHPQPMPYGEFSAGVQIVGHTLPTGRHTPQGKEIGNSRRGTQIGYNQSTTLPVASISDIKRPIVSANNRRTQTGAIARTEPDSAGFYRETHTRTSASLPPEPLLPGHSQYVRQSDAKKSSEPYVRMQYIAHRSFPSRAEACVLTQTADVPENRLVQITEQRRSTLQGPFNRAHPYPSLTPSSSEMNASHTESRQQRVKSELRQSTLKSMALPAHQLPTGGSGRSFGEAENTRIISSRLHRLNEVQSFPHQERRARSANAAPQVVQPQRNAEADKKVKKRSSSSNSIAEVPMEQILNWQKSMKGKFVSSFSSSEPIAIRESLGSATAGDALAPYELLSQSIKTSDQIPKIVAGFEANLDFLSDDKNKSISTYKTRTFGGTVNFEYLDSVMSSANSSLFFGEKSSKSSPVAGDHPRKGKGAAPAVGSSVGKKADPKLSEVPDVQTQVPATGTKSTMMQTPASVKSSSFSSGRQKALASLKKMEEDASRKKKLSSFEPTDSSTSFARKFDLTQQSSTSGPNASAVTAKAPPPPPPPPVARKSSDFDLGTSFGGVAPALKDNSSSFDSRVKMFGPIKGGEGSLDDESFEFAKITTTNKKTGDSRFEFELD